jgi:hypothetical protein
MKKVIRLTESDLTRIVKRVIQEQSEHVKNLYKSWANKRSGNPEKALSIIDDVFKYQNKLSKKDFAQYSSYEELVGDLNRIKQDAKSTDATKLYEDSELLVLAANTWEASCKYGAGSKWCTTAKDSDSYWNRHNQTGTEFFWIFKNKPQSDPNHKFSYHIKLNGKPDWCNAVNDCMGDERLSGNSYPKKHPKYNEIINKLQEFHKSRDLTEKFAIEQKNKKYISDLVADNYDYIIYSLDLERIIKEHFDFAYNDSLDQFLDYEIEEMVPRSLELDDEEGISQFKEDLKKYLSDQKPELPQIKFTQFIGDLSYVIYDTLIKKFNINAGEPIEEQIEENDINFEVVLDKIDDYELDEIISEFISTEVNDLIYDIATRYAFDYQP